MSERQQAKRDRAYAAFGHMDVNTSFDACGDDGEWSAGAEWCDTVFVTAREAWDQERFEHDSDRNDHDVASELADSVTPVLTHNRWLVFVDLCAYTSDHAEESETRGGTMTDMAGGVLYDMANDAIVALVEGWREDLSADTCADCGSDMNSDGHCPECDGGDGAAELEECCLHCSDDCKGGHTSDTCGHCMDGCC
jgi:hypothetical protein